MRQKVCCKPLHTATGNIVSNIIKKKQTGVFRKVLSEWGPEMDNRKYDPLPATHYITRAKIQKKYFKLRIKYFISNHPRDRSCRTLYKTMLAPHVLSGVDGTQILSWYTSINYILAIKKHILFNFLVSRFWLLVASIIMYWVWCISRYIYISGTETLKIVSVPTSESHFNNVIAINPLQFLNVTALWRI